MTPADVVLTDVYHALAGEPHPLRPKPGAASSPESAKTHHEQLADRLRAQQARLARPKEAG